MEPAVEEQDPSYGTRWRRTAPVLVLGMGALVVLLGLVRVDVIALNGVYSGSAAKFSSSGVTGADVGFGVAEMTRKRADGTTETLEVVRAGFATAELNEFCMSMVESVPLVGDVTIKITAGDGNPGTYEIKASNIVLDLEKIKGTGTGVNLDGEVQIGLATQDITTLSGVVDPLGQPGIGYFGIDAARGYLYNISGRLHNAEIGGPIQLPGLQITVTPGGSECAVNAAVN